MLQQIQEAARKAEQSSLPQKSEVSEEKPKPKGTSFKNLNERILGFDMFQTPFHFNLPTGSSSFPTKEGLCFSGLLVIVLGVYGVV